MIRIASILFLLMLSPALAQTSDVPSPPSQLPRLQNTGALPPPPPLQGTGGPGAFDQSSLPGQRLPTGETPAGQITQQAQGIYPVLERSPTLPLGALQRAWDMPFAALGQVSPGVVRYFYRPDKVMALRTREFMMTTIHLPPFEKVRSIVVGDPVVFQVQQVSSNVFGVRPNHAGGDSNITVIGTSNNVYSFYVRSEGYNSDQISDITVYIEGEQPGAGGVLAGSGGAIIAGQPSGDVSRLSDALAASINGGPAVAPDYIRKIAFRPDNLNFDMTILAPLPEDIEIAPMRVFNDGVWTYFDFGDKVDSMRRPVIFMVEDGVDAMINTRTVGPKGNILIAEALGDFTLRNGNRIICVYRNETLRRRENPQLMRAQAEQFQTNPDQLILAPPQDIHMDEKSGGTNRGFLDNVSSWFQ